MHDENGVYQLLKWKMFLVFDSCEVFSHSLATYEIGEQREREYRELVAQRALTGNLAKKEKKY